MSIKLKLAKDGTIKNDLWNQYDYELKNFKARLLIVSKVYSVETAFFQLVEEPNFKLIYKLVQLLFCYPLGAPESIFHLQSV